MARVGTITFMKTGDCDLKIYGVKLQRRKIGWWEKILEGLSLTVTDKHL